MLAIGRDSVARMEEMRRPDLRVRALAGLVIAGALVLVAWIVHALHVRTDVSPSWMELVQVGEASIGSAVFIGAAIMFLVTLDRRIKRGRTLAALHELRSVAHIIDLHQIAKDPPVVTQGADTASARADLVRYLDLCSDMLSLTANLAALFVQDMPDPVVLETVDGIEALTNGLSRKIWQKIMIIERFGGAE
jgi:hypothetical protein